MKLFFNFGGCEEEEEGRKGRERRNRRGGEGKEVLRRGTL